MKIILFFVRKILSLRYDVELIGEEELNHDGPILILPNHVALVDPRILISFLGKYLSVSPVASEKYYNKPVIRQIMDAVGTVPIGEMDAGADSDKVKEVFAKVVEALKSGKNILIYPSGQIYRQGFESIKGKQAAYNIANLMPKNTKVIGIRDRGLWGSMWSMAWDNGKTGFGKLYLKSIGYVFSNLIFFVPKRKVNIEIVDITKQINSYKKMSLNEFNLFLENFYNKIGEEKINYLKHYFYYNDVKNKKEPKIISGSLKELNNIKKHDLSKIDEKVKEKIINKIAKQKEISREKINDKSNLILDLFFDSLDLAEIKGFIQANFSGASNAPIADLKSVGDLLVMAMGLSENVEKLKECKWYYFTTKGSVLKNINGKIETIPELWRENFNSNKYEDFLWDNILGKQSKKDFIIKTYLISDYIKKIDGEYIGIMLPAVGSASMIIMATYLAGKIPVMFNWTSSKDGFVHCINFSKVDKILTSSNFFDKINNDFLGKYDKNGKFIFVEELLKNITILDKLKAFIKSFYMPIPKKTAENNAVILFTSGSESLPKAVALTHKNIIENIKGAVSIFDFKQDDILLGFLPPFHSFGFTVNTIMPLISGSRVVYSPDPNDAKTILNIIKHTKITSITATPTFLKMIMSLALRDDFKNIKYVVVGAEKCPTEVFQKFKELCPKGTILEGYGITECSPVVSINPVVGAKPGTVGKIIPCLDCKIIDIDSGNEQNNGEQGMIFIKGKSIFGGYLDDKIDNPFEKINIKGDNSGWYKTGDLGFLDNEGFLSITGRLKRFIKIAGEMISLPSIEGILLEKYGSNDELKIAIEALENEGKVKIVLFSVEYIEVEEVNDFMRRNGIPNLVKISEVIKIDEIPVLGTGKTDYKVLKKMINFDKN